MQNQKDNTKEDLIKQKEDELKILDTKNKELEQEDNQINKDIEGLDQQIKDLGQNDLENQKMNKRRQRLEGLMDQSRDNLNSLTKIQLEEIENYKTPPDRIKKALEVIFLLLEGKVLEWDKIKAKLNQGTFVKKMLSFNINKVKLQIIKKVKKEYIDQDDWNLEKLKRASKAMGPLGSWLEIITEQIKELSKKKSQKPKEDKDKLNNLETKKKNLLAKSKILKEKILKNEKKKKLIKEQIDNINKGTAQCSKCLSLEKELLQYKNCENCDFMYSLIQSYELKLNKKTRTIHELQNCENCQYIYEQLQDTQKKLKQYQDPKSSQKDCKECQNYQQQIQELKNKNQQFQKQLEKTQESQDIKNSESIVNDKILNNCKSCLCIYQMYLNLENKDKQQIHSISTYQNCKNCLSLFGIIQKIQEKQKSNQDHQSCQNCPQLQQQNKDLQNQISNLETKVDYYKKCENCLFIYDQLQNSEKQVRELIKERYFLQQKQDELLIKIKQLTTMLQQNNVQVEQQNNVQVEQQNNVQVEQQNNVQVEQQNNVERQQIFQSAKQNPQQIQVKSFQNPQQIQVKSFQNPQQIQVKSFQNPQQIQVKQYQESYEQKVYTPVDNHNCDSHQFRKNYDTEVSIQDNQSTSHNQYQFKSALYVNAQFEKQREDENETMQQIPVTTRSYIETQVQPQIKKQKYQVYSVQQNQYPISYKTVNSFNYKVHTNQDSKFFQKDIQPKAQIKHENNHQNKIKKITYTEIQQNPVQQQSKNEDSVIKKSDSTMAYHRKK